MMKAPASPRTMRQYAYMGHIPTASYAGGINAQPTAGLQGSIDKLAEAKFFIKYLEEDRRKDEEAWKTTTTAVKSELAATKTQLLLSKTELAKANEQLTSVEANFKFIEEQLLAAKPVQVQLAITVEQATASEALEVELATARQQLLAATSEITSLRTQLAAAQAVQKELAETQKRLRATETMLEEYATADTKQLATETVQAQLETADAALTAAYATLPMSEEETLNTKLAFADMLQAQVETEKAQLLARKATLEHLRDSSSSRNSCASSGSSWRISTGRLQINDDDDKAQVAKPLSPVEFALRSPVSKSKIPLIQLEVLPEHSGKRTAFTKMFACFGSFEDVPTTKASEPKPCKIGFKHRLSAFARKFSFGKQESKVITVPVPAI